MNYFILIIITVFVSCVNIEKLEISDNDINNLPDLNEKIELTGFVDSRIGARRAQGNPTRDGNQTVSAVAPFGMLQVGPDNEHLKDNFFTGLHLGIAAGNGAQYGMGFVGKTLPVPALLATSFPDYSTEGVVVWEHQKAQPGYLRGIITYNRSYLTVEIVVRRRYAIVRLVRPEEGPISIYVPKATSISSTRVDGYENYVGSNNCGRFYFSLLTKKPADTTNDKGIGYTSLKELIYLAGVSSVSGNSSHENILVGDIDFDTERADAINDWENELRRIRIHPQTSYDLKVKFYTAFYRSLMYPQVFSDNDGRYSRFGRTRTTIDSLPSDWDNYYTHFSGWDTYRIHTPLIALMYPHIASEQARSLLVDARIDGKVPKWKLWADDDKHMTGNPGAIIIAWSYLLGANGFNIEQNDFQVLENRVAPTSFPQRPSPEIDHGVANFVLSRLGRHMGDKQFENKQLELSQRWWELWNSRASETAGTLGGIRPKDNNLNWKSNGTWGYGDGSDYVEAGQADTQWLAHWDLAKLVDLMGGTYNARLRLNNYFWDQSLGRSLIFLNYNNLFTLYNQPVYSIPWTWGQIGDMERQVEEIHRIINEDFLNEIGSGALPGNDDLGSTSAWFVWSSLGLYPYWPGIPALAVSTPIFKEAKIQFGAKKLTISREGEGKFIVGVLVNGRALTTTWVLINDLLENNENYLIVRTGNRGSWGENSTPPDWRSLDLAGANSLPGIMAPESVVLRQGDLSPELDILVHDLETRAENLVISAVSSDNTLIGDEGLILSGTNNRRRLRIRAKDRVSGACEVTLNIFDGMKTSKAVIKVLVVE